MTTINLSGDLILALLLTNLLVNILVLFRPWLKSIFLPVVHWFTGTKSQELPKEVSEEPTQEDTETAEDITLEEIKHQLEAAATGTLDEDKPGPDDNSYEFLVEKQLRDARGTIYYANYTKSNVDVTGKLIRPNCLQLLAKHQMTEQHGSVQPLEDWDDEYDSNIRFVLRVGLLGENYLIWGLTREAAYLNLFAFLQG